MPIAWIDELIEVIQDPDRVSWGSSVRDLHASDFSYHPPQRPDVVVYPTTANEVSAIVRFAHDRHLPVMGYGQGTSVEGHVIPIHGGITVDFERMNQVVAIRADDFVVQVAPGITRSALNHALGPYGLFFPVDPGADASLGGMAATNAGRDRSVSLWCHASTGVRRRGSLGRRSHRARRWIYDEVIGGLSVGEPFCGI